MLRFLAANWKDIGYLVGIIALASYTFYKEMRQRRLRVKYKVSPNPKQCGEHAVAIGKLDERMKHVEEDVKEIKGELRGRR